MKKSFPILLIAISLFGTFLIYEKLYSVATENRIRQLPPIPINLDVATKPLSISIPQAVPILMYHHIQIFPGSQNPSDADIFVSPQSFESQLQWLAAHNFQTVGLDYFSHPTPMTKKPIILTFDDGYQDAYDTSFPLLKKYGFTGTFYPIADDIDKSGFVSSDEIVQMEKGGMTFGSHTLSHPNLTTLTTAQAEQEIYASKIILQRITAAPVTDFCYPGGTFNAAVETIVQNSGYTTATTTVTGTNIGTADPLTLNRLQIKNNTKFGDVPELNH